MKTLIVYASTYGYTKECVQQLSGKLEGEVSTVNAMSEGIPALSEYDNIIIGGSIYMGQLQKKLKGFCISNAGELSKKKLGLFLCCGIPENFDKSMANAFPEGLLKHAVAKECFGGVLRPERMKFVHRMISGLMKKSAEKEGKATDRPMPENIEKLAILMKKA